MAEVNLADLEKLSDAGASVTPEALLERGLIRKSALKSVVILGQGELKKSLTVNPHRFSKSAKQKIEDAGGKAELIEDRGSKSRIEDRRSKNDGGTERRDPRSTILYLLYSIFDSKEVCYVRIIPQRSPQFVQGTDLRKRVLLGVLIPTTGIHIPVPGVDGRLWRSSGGS